MKYEFIEGLTDMNGNVIEEYDKVTLRNGGTDQQLLRFKDILLQRLCKDRAAAVQEGEPCIVFIDGEFWGFYMIREKQDADYVEAHYSIDKDNVTFLKNGFIDEGDAAVAAEYQDFLYWAAEADMTVEENYQRVCDTVDIQSLMDYITIETYINNCDWATSYMNNWIAWRANTADSANAYADGKWRFMLYALDFSSDYFNDGRTLAGFDSLNNLCTADEPYNFVPMFYNLLNNETFRQQFYDTYLEIMDENFAPDNVIETVNEYDALYGEAIWETNIRFDQEWVNTSLEDELQQFRQYFIDRRNTAKLYLDKLYGIESISAEGSDLTGGNASDWTYYGAGTPSKSKDTYTMKVNTTGVNSWDIQSQIPQFTLEKGEFYKVSFYASSTTSSPISYNINHQVGTSWPAAASMSNISLTPQLQYFESIFYMSAETASNWRLCFDYGIGSGTYVVQNAAVKRIQYEQELVGELGGWSLYNPSGAAELTETDSNSVMLKTTALPAEVWEAQALYSGIVLNEGDTYTLEFTVKSDTAAKITAQVQQNYGEYSSYISKTVDTVATEKTYSYIFTADSSCYDAAVCFNCGGALGTYEITDVSLKRVID